MTKFQYHLFNTEVIEGYMSKNNQTECIDDQLGCTFGDKTLNPATVERWLNKIERGRGFLQYEFREGRPRTAIVPETIDAVRETIEMDRHVTYRKIEAALGISGTSMHLILHIL
ncbi:uncharacterized protein LOC119666320 [Teleopsis dalmanni]|uniref:uncharacterized protein LOC119666320 n=1 Tax=Teleopsis dalmanni TaxID=139649 RepID=UPI0018CDEB65|nr:uncharacterized protein LOC119666320 [Teleopsis dalmanni]